MTKDRRDGGVEVHKTGRRADDIVADPVDVLEAISNLGDDYKSLGKSFQDYVISDLEWKKVKDQRDKDNQPAIDNMKNLSNSGMLVVKISLGITAIGGAILMLYKVLSLRH